MTKFVLALLVTGSALVGVPGAHANTAMVCVDTSNGLQSPIRNEPCGRGCTFTSTADVTREAGWQTGVIAAGPLVTAEAGTLKCTIHVNNNMHNGSAVVTETVGDTAGVGVVMIPRALNYPATAFDDVVLCTEWHGASGTLYWVGPDPAKQWDTGHWTTDASASCTVGFTPDNNGDPTCGVWLAIDERAGTNIAEIWQDCETYSPII